MTGLKILNVINSNCLQSILLTTDKDAITFVEGSPASRDRVQIKQFENFERNAAEEAARQNNLLKEHFLIDIHNYIQKTYPDYKKIIETFGSRAVYFKRLLQAVRNCAVVNTYLTKLI